jgi:NDP-sugar pyrophosphorylase family protein
MDEQILKFAEESGLAYKTPKGTYWIDAGYPDIHLEQFAELVRQDEREKIGNVLEEIICSYKKEKEKLWQEFELRSKHD